MDGESVLSECFDDNDDIHKKLVDFKLKKSKQNSGLTDMVSTKSKPLPESDQPIE